MISAFKNRVLLNLWNLTLWELAEFLVFTNPIFKVEKKKGSGFLQAYQEGERGKFFINWKPPNTLNYKVQLKFFFLKGFKVKRARTDKCFLGQVVWQSLERAFYILWSLISLYPFIIHYQIFFWYEFFWLFHKYSIVCWPCLPRQEGYCVYIHYRV